MSIPASWQNRPPLFAPDVRRRHSADQCIPRGTTPSTFRALQTWRVRKGRHVSVVGLDAKIKLDKSLGGSCHHQPPRSQGRYCMMSLGSRGTCSTTSYVTSRRFLGERNHNGKGPKPRPLDIKLLAVLRAKALGVPVDGVCDAGRIRNTTIDGFFDDWLELFHEQCNQWVRMPEAED